MKKLIAIAASGFAFCLASGCGNHSGSVASSPDMSGHVQDASFTTSSTQDFQPYNLIPNAAPVPVVKTQTHRKLVITRHAGEVYLTDVSGHSYNCGRDSEGRLYPSYYDSVTHEDYPLYYDAERDRYYRVLSRNNEYYSNYVGDPSDEYFQCDNNINYSSYDPPADDCPVISDGDVSFTFYDEPDYYRHPHRHWDHWRSDDWYSALPVIVGFYFILDSYHSGGDSWYYGYHGHDHRDRFAYQPGYQRENLVYRHGGQTYTNYVIATPPARLQAPRRQWSHLAKIYPSNHANMDNGHGLQVHQARTMMAGGIHESVSGPDNHHIDVQHRGNKLTSNFGRNTNNAHLIAFHSEATHNPGQIEHAAINGRQIGARHEIAHAVNPQNHARTDSFHAPVRNAAIQSNHHPEEHRLAAFTPSQRQSTQVHRNNSFMTHRADVQNHMPRHQQSFARNQSWQHSQAPQQHQNFMFRNNGGNNRPAQQFQHSQPRQQNFSRPNQGAQRPNPEFSRPAGNFHGGGNHGAPGGGGQHQNENHGGGQPDNRRH